MFSKFARCVFVFSALFLITGAASAEDALTSIKALDGTWLPTSKMENSNNCPAGAFLIKSFVSENGDISGVVGHSQDGPFRFSTSIDKDGYVSFFAQGQYVMIRGDGTFTDTRGSGQFEVSGEANCSGEWELLKQ